MFFQAQHKRFDKPKAISSLLGQVGGHTAGEAEHPRKLSARLGDIWHTAAWEFTGRKETGCAALKRGAERSPRLITKPCSDPGSWLCRKMSFSCQWPLCCVGCGASAFALSVPCGRRGENPHYQQLFPIQELCELPGSPGSSLLAGDALAAGGTGRLSLSLPRLGYGRVIGQRSCDSGLCPQETANPAGLGMHCEL